MSCFKDHASLGYFYTNPYIPTLIPTVIPNDVLAPAGIRRVINGIDQIQALISFTKRSTAQISKRTGKPIMDEIKKKLS